MEVTIDVEDIEKQIQEKVDKHIVRHLGKIVREEVEKRVKEIIDEKFIKYDYICQVEKYVDNHIDFWLHEKVYQALCQNAIYREFVAFQGEKINQEKRREYFSGIMNAFVSGKNTEEYEDFENKLINSLAQEMSLNLRYNTPRTKRIAEALISINSKKEENQ